MIARKFLIPKQLGEHGLDKKGLKINDAALRDIAEKYTAEAGVRNLERTIATICRKVAREMVENGGKAKKSFAVTAENLVDYLKAPHYYPEAKGRKNEVGIATGLAWTAVGGVILFVEAIKMPGKGGMILTGQLGEVMQESAKAAYSYVKARAATLGIPPEDFDKFDIHVHVPAGATPKDGPSAGVAMATAIASVFSGRPVKHEMAMTGEITLRGKVMPIGGVREKLLAAVRAGLPSVLFPRQNENEVLEIDEGLRKKAKVLYAETIDDVFNAALQAPVKVGRAKQPSNGNGGRPAAKKAKAKTKTKPRGNTKPGARPGRRAPATPPS